MSDQSKASGAAEISADDLVAEFDVGARNPDNWQGKMLAGVALIWALFQIYNASVLPFTLSQWTGFSGFVFNSDKERAIHLAFALFLACTAFPLFKKSPRSHIPWYDWALGLGGVVVTMYLVFNQSAIALRSGLPTTIDLIISASGLLIVLIATYRALGLPMVVVAAFFLVYVFFGDQQFIPDGIQWKGASFSKAMWHFWMQTEGVFGQALGVSASMVFLFVLFGSLLEKAGAGNYFIQVAFALMGHMRGGPAKAAVVASAATGLISGSSIANTVTTGTFTIPLMKRVGFSAEKAGAVEVASSTNGQLTPPVMGAAAFLMIEYVGIPYMQVIQHAFLPAVISYIALVYIVHLEACKMGMEGLPRPGAPKTRAQRLMGIAFGFLVFIVLALGVYYGLGWLKPMFGDYTMYGMIVVFLIAYLGLIWWASKYPDLVIDDPNSPLVKLPEIGPVAKTGYYYGLPVVVLIWCLMIERFSPGLAAFWATLAMIFVSITQHALKAMFRGEGKIAAGIAYGWSQLIDGMIAGSRNMIGIAVATGTAGIIVGTVGLTGAHLVIGEFIEYISGGSLILMLIYVAIFSLVLGMGLPTTATYIVIVTLMAPVIITVGAQSGLIVPLIAVHMFVFYFGILADDTPPVGLAAFAAAAISGGDPIKTGIIGFSYDMRTAILPFLFIFNTELLLIDVTPMKAVFVFFVATVAMLLFASATQNWWLTKNRMWENAALLLIAFTLFNPGYWLNMYQAPYVDTSPTEIARLATEAADDDVLRIRVTGENFASGKITTTTVELPLGAKDYGDGPARLEQFAGIAFAEGDDGVVVDNVVFGKMAQDKGIDFDWQVLNVEVPAERPFKEWFYIPAVLLLMMIWLLQKGRIRKQKEQVA
ncbi:MAG: TRAP transporter permease [Rhodobacteraceae bacterium]|nr:TRAP transporter permease [Paracoccaceae bacterium]